MVVGRERLPELSDRERLPFLECVVKEVYRWNPPAPIGAAHRLMEDDFYNGYLIPKGKMKQSCLVKHGWEPRRMLTDNLDRDYRDCEHMGNDPRSTRVPRSNGIQSPPLLGRTFVS